MCPKQIGSVKISSLCLYKNVTIKKLGIQMGSQPGQHGLGSQSETDHVRRQMHIQVKEETYWF